MFTGRVRKRRLPVGRYTLVASATGRAGKAAARARARFTIVR
jgi:Holliday junction resolvasome RuvABC ATP-dependent DNA helicase subunit